MKPLLLDKGKKVQPSASGLTDSYKHAMLANLHFKPLDKIDDVRIERLQFGQQNLIAYEPSNLTFRHLSNCQLDKQQKCLIDNIWIAHNKKDTKYVIAVLNALGYYFPNKNKENRFKYYVVILGKTNGVFQTWIEVLDSIKKFQKPLFKGFNDFTEALDYARGILGPNYYISPALRQNPDKIPQYNIQRDTDKVIFCNHCSSMTEAFKRLNLKNEALMQENATLRERLNKMESKGKNVKNQTDTQGFPSQTKMDEMSVHSPLNAKKSTVSDEDTASPVQTVAGKDFSNPLMAVTLPKSERDESSSSRRKLHFCLIVWLNESGNFLLEDELSSLSLFGKVTAINGFEKSLPATI